MPGEAPATLGPSLPVDIRRAKIRTEEDKEQKKKKPSAQDTLISKWQIASAKSWVVDAGRASARLGYFG